jgi:hypothetical protein
MADLSLTPLISEIAYGAIGIYMSMIPTLQQEAG